MTIVRYKRANGFISRVELKGHANFDDSGKDIVCSSISSISATTINAILRIYRESITFANNGGYVLIEVKQSDEVVEKLLINMIELLKELSITYSKNVKVILEK